MGQQQKDPDEWDPCDLVEDAWKQVQMNDGPPRRLVHPPEDVAGLTAYKRAYWLTRVQVEVELLEHRLAVAQRRQTDEQLDDFLALEAVLPRAYTDLIRLRTYGDVWAALGILQRGVATLEKQAKSSARIFSNLQLAILAGSRGQRVSMDADECCPDCGSDMVCEVSE